MQKNVRIVFVGVALGLVAAVGWRYALSTENKGKALVDKPVVVSATTVKVRDTPVILSSVATVQAFNTVLIRSRVDGEISKVIFKEGTSVRRGQELIELDRRPFEAQLKLAKAQREKDIAQLDNAKLDADRYEDLVKKDSVSTQTLDTARALLAQLKATVHADEAQIDLASLQLDYATIRAPIDGRIGARLVDVGNLVHANDTTGLLTMAQIQPVMIQFSLPQSVESELRHQQARGVLPVDALDETNNRVLDHGKLTLVDNQIDPLTRTILCKAIFDNKNENLWPGAFVTARLHLSNLPHAMVVPSTTIQTGANGMFVYVVTSKQTAEMRPVEVGATDGTDTVVVKGLKEGEIVITDGQFLIEQGTRVEARMQGNGEMTGLSATKPSPAS